MSSTPDVIEYRGTAYRQSRDLSAAWVASFVGRADDVLDWAGIPRRRDPAGGFQRVADPARINKAKKFFDTALNQSPTALIIGVHKTPPGCEPLVEFELGEKIEFGTPAEEEAGDDLYECTLRVYLSKMPTAIPDSVDRVRAQLKSRLTDEDSLEIDNDEVDAEITDTTDDDDEPSLKGASVELTHSLVSSVYEKLDDPNWVKQNAEAILDMAMPATVIDGQHRVLGAKACERGVPFSICAIVDCDWSEQVFQFTVVNYTSQGIPDQFITANAALSLTERELLGLKDRLQQAGVKVVEYDLMRVVNFMEESPFKGLVNLTERKDKTLIGYKTMVATAKAWYSGKGPVFDVLLPLVYPNITGKGKVTRRRTEWQNSGLWGDFFLAFWKVVRATYENEKTESGYSLWDPQHSNLMTAVVLQRFQEAFLQDLNNQDEDYFDTAGQADPTKYLLGRICQRAKKFVSYYPPAFFATEWGMKSLNNSSGKKALDTAIQNMYSQKGKYQYDKSALVSGEV